MNKPIQADRVAIRNLVIFSVVVLSIGWTGRGLDVLMDGAATESLGMGLRLIVPTALCLLLCAFAGDGWRNFGVRPNYKGNAVWYVVALLVYPVLTALVLVVGRGLGPVEDAFLNQLFTDGHIRIVPGTDWLVSPATGLVGISLFAAVGFGLHRLRRGMAAVS